MLPLATLLSASMLHAWPLGLVQCVQAFAPPTADARVARMTPRSIVPDEPSFWANAGSSVLRSVEGWVDRGSDGAWELSFDGTLFRTGQVDWVGYVSARRPGDRTIESDPLLSLRVPGGVRFDLPNTAFDPVVELAATVRSVNGPRASPTLYDSTFGVRWTP